MKILPHLEYYHVLGVVEGAGEIDLRSKQVRDQVITPRDTETVRHSQLIMDNQQKWTNQLI